MTKSAAAMLSIRIRQERPSGRQSIGQRKPVIGIGINDADYHKDGVGGMCPAYRQWQNMLARCYSERELKKRPSYNGCAVDQSWLSFMAFRDWWLENHVDGWQLDKDLLVFGNKTYGPDTCCFVPCVINNFLTDRLRLRGDFPLGVCYHGATGKFQAYCSHNGRQVHLGLFGDAESAHDEWIRYKLLILDSLKPEMDGIDGRIYFTVQKTILEAK